MPLLLQHDLAKFLYPQTHEGKEQVIQNFRSVEHISKQLSHKVWFWRDFQCSYFNSYTFSTGK